MLWENHSPVKAIYVEVLFEVAALQLLDNELQAVNHCKTHRLLSILYVFDRPCLRQTMLTSGHNDVLKVGPHRRGCWFTSQGHRTSLRATTPPLCHRVVAIAVVAHIRDQFTLPLSYRLLGLVVKASASGAEDPGFESRLRRDFSGVESNQ